MASRSEIRELECVICAELFTDATTIRCGHSYCMECIKTFRQSKTNKYNKYSCPICKDPLGKEPELKKSTALCALVELSKTAQQKQLPSPTASEDGTHDSQCDICNTERAKATCLTSKMPYCPKHVETHYENVPLKSHKLASAVKTCTTACSKHRNVIEFVCKTDGEYLCVDCVAAHPACSYSSVQGEFDKKKETLKTKLESVTSAIQTTEENLAKRRKEKGEIEESAARINESLSREFAELRQVLEEREKAALSAVRSSQKAASSRVSRLIHGLSSARDVLQRKKSELELVNVTDCFEFLRTDLPESEESSLAVDEESTALIQEEGSAVKDAVSDLKKDVQSKLDNAINAIKQTQAEEITEAVPESEAAEPENDTAPKRSAEFTQCFANLTFDPNTAHKHLALSEGNRRVTVKRNNRSVPYMPERFTISQVMASTGFSEGCHYWEVNTRLSKGWAIGIAYQRLRRADTLGRNALSWCVEWSRSRFSAWHGSVEVRLPQGDPSGIGVHLKCDEGKVSFYAVSVSETLLHTFDVRFSEPVFPVFWLFGLDKGNSLSFVEL
ncbi:E3 ubiquitin-protein ligase RNF135-like [Acipenser oxyrinchus oxyrinchus]|uniref:E3 ubiquitin-protein ligase RNF135-like n=1 Tax=Acipenser oxyrinchus oxyrinchus TaxID=40147 RepID=A0AAD8D522_ACIOX|nr:E3 ubiquitin-protein ligase RNF135-like [Acipenser oxyrinchus oxyrinchus]